MLTESPGYSRRLDVVNRGLSGYNTANVLEYFDRLIPEKTPSSPEIKYLVKAKLSPTISLQLTAVGYSYRRKRCSLTTPQHMAACSS